MVESVSGSPSHTDDGPVMDGVAGGAQAGQPGSLNAPMRVRHGAPPVEAMYSVVNQNVQSSTGSTDIMA